MVDRKGTHHFATASSLRHITWPMHQYLFQIINHLKLEFKKYEKMPVSFDDPEKIPSS